MRKYCGKGILLNCQNLFIYYEFNSSRVQFKKISLPDTLQCRILLTSILTMLIYKFEILLLFRFSTSTYIISTPKSPYSNFQYKCTYLYNREIIKVRTNNRYLKFIPIITIILYYPNILHVRDSF